MNTMTNNEKQFYKFILDEYGDESEQAKNYRMGMWDPEYRKDPKAFRLNVLGYKY